MFAGAVQASLCALALLPEMEMGKMLRIIVSADSHHPGPPGFRVSGSGSRV